MKNYIIILIFAAVYGLATSCESMFGDFLDKAPGVDVTEDTIFSSVAQVETLLASCYENGSYSGYPYSKYWYGSTGYQTSSSQDFAYFYAAAADEADYFASWYGPNHWNAGTITVYNGPGVRLDDFDVRYDARWTAFRMIYLMLQKVDDVPGIDPAYAAMIKGEMKFLLALNYLEMFKRYGGVPIVRERLELNADINIKRSTVNETVQFIVQMCDEAAAVLPDTWDSNWKGRATKGSALACKAKTLLYAASPIFNTATPYLSMNDPADNTLICFGNYNINRWKDAADAAKAVIDWAPAGGVLLVTDKGVDKNYKYVWEVMDNSEIIHADKQTNGNWKAQYTTWISMLPRPFGGWSGTTVTQNIVEYAFDSRYTGKPIVWYANGIDLNQKYDSMDYRFKQSVGYNTNFWNTARGNLQTFQGGSHATQCITGMWTKKFIPDAVNNANGNYPVNWPIFRLAEFYLGYAEALNEFNASPPADAYTYVNAIRARSGMPDFPAGLSKEQFRARLRREWAAEYFLEDRRFWDIRRWLIAEEPGVMMGDMYGLKIYKQGTGTPQQYRYEKYVFEIRVFKKQFYLHPFYVSEINKGYIVQNPGW